MRIRLPFAGGFFFLLLIAGYAGLTSVHLGALINDKVLHFLTFFILTVVFYWIIDTNRRRTLNLTLIVCTSGLGVGSEFLQSILPNDRNFDIYDIVANLVGSLSALGLCSWYHKRMLERKRARRGYGAVAGQDDDDSLGDENDLELGEGLGPGGSGHEEGITDAPRPDDTTPAKAGGRGLTLEEEVDNWDENEVDAWDDADGAGDIGDSTPMAKNKNAKGPANGDGHDGGKRAD